MAHFDKGKFFISRPSGDDVDDDYVSSVIRCTCLLSLKCLKCYIAVLSVDSCEKYHLFT